MLHRRQLLLLLAERRPLVGGVRDGYTRLLLDPDADVALEHADDPVTKSSASA